MSARILLADDHAVLREGLALMIDSRPELTVVGQASDGREAIDLATRLCPDVVVMDIWMPRVSGIEATREIIRQNPDARVVMLSVHENQSMVECSVRAGAKGYVVKSACSNELFEAIDAVGRGRSYLSPVVTQWMIDAISTAGRRPPEGISSLTSREREVLQQVAEGRASKEIARELHISPRTVESHRASLMRKLGVHKTSGLVRIAIREELVAP